MIAYAAPLPVGNAAKLIVALPAGALKVRVLRKAADTFSGVDDPQAAPIYDGVDGVAIDTSTLANGVPYYYKAFATSDGSTWAAGETVSVTPACSQVQASPDVLTLVRERIEAGLKAECAANRLPLNDKGRPPQVFTAPPQVENVAYPAVTVHLRSDSSGQRAIGEIIAADVFDAIGGDWTASEGSLCAVTLDIVGWVQGNSDTRSLLRQALKRILWGNLEVFDAAGLLAPEFSFADVEDLESFGTPMFQVMATMTCVAPFNLTHTDPAIADVSVGATTYP